MEERDRHGRPALPDVSRREALKYLGGGALALAAGRSADNVLVGYGSLVGTNLREQAETGALDEIAHEGFGRRERYAAALGERTLRLDGDTLSLQGADGAAFSRDVTALSSSEARELDDRHGLAGGPVAELTRDLPALSDVDFQFHRFEPFFERLATAETRPFTVGAVRGPLVREVAPSDVTAFADVDPTAPQSVLTGLESAFREHTDYDIPRYVAGAVQDNVIFGAADLRAPFREPVEFGALADADGPRGMFCYEFTARSVEALHAVPAHRQRVPVLSASVFDERHKHVYSIVASVVREDGRLVVPATFVDYTHSTLYDDLNLRWALGEGFEAFNDRHRATAIRWGHP